MICFAGFICSFHFALCSAILCVAHTADSPMASVTLAVPGTAGEARDKNFRKPQAQHVYELQY